MTYQPPPPYQAPIPPYVPPATMQPKGKPWWARRWITYVIVGLLALLIGVTIGTSTVKTKNVAGPTVQVTTTATATATVQVTTTPTDVTATVRAVVTQTYTPPPQNQFTDGVQLVGTDIPAGTYKTDGTGDGSNAVGCYYAVLNSSSTDDISNNTIITGPTRVALRAGKYFETTGGCSWARVG